jgi:hypothetical protein
MDRDRHRTDRTRCADGAKPLEQIRYRHRGPSPKTPARLHGPCHRWSRCRALRHRQAGFAPTATTGSGRRQVPRDCRPVTCRSRPCSPLHRSGLEPRPGTKVPVVAAARPYAGPDAGGGIDTRGWFGQRRSP